LKKTFEIPKKGVKVYSPEEGWSSSPYDISNNTINNSEKLATNINADKSEENFKSDPSTIEVKANSPNDASENYNSNNMVAVGDALEQLFETLNNSSSVDSPEANPTWREVAELSRILEEKLDSRKEVLDKLSLIDEELHSTRKELLLTLKKLGKFENEQLSAATIRASVSAMAIEVLAKKLT
jgi:hypothetical protein